jgi:TubC N-terminal docking domain
MDIINEINLAGVLLSLDGDRIKIENSQNLTDALRDLIRNNKPNLIAILSQSKVAQPNWTQKDRGVFCYRLKDKPDSELWMLTPNTSLDKATDSLKGRYGDRLISVYESPNSNVLH